MPGVEFAFLGDIQVCDVCKDKLGVGKERQSYLL